MRYFVLATDYDGTIAADGVVDQETLDALQRVRESGRRLILVSGRELDDLNTVFDRWDLFDWAVLENGALLFNPATKEEFVLGEPPPAEFVAELERRGVEPMSVGRAIVATWEPHETTVLETIRDLELERQVIFNKGAVMVLPTGVNKETGLREALDRLGLSAHNTVGVGDAENDHAFLSCCELAVAVGNALPSVKERADYVTRRGHGAGVQTLIEHVLDDDLAAISERIHRYDIELGMDAAGASVCVKPFGDSILVAGPSGSGKSTATTGIIERLAEKGYQFCLIDPEGDYEDFAGAVTFGDAHLAPNVDEVLKLLAQPSENVVVDLLGVRLDDRPNFFAGLLPRLLEMRVKTGRPHWIVVDEAHHLLPHEWQPAGEQVPRQLHRLLLVTVHPESVSPAILQQVGVVIAVGDAPERTFAAFAKAIDVSPPRFKPDPLRPGEVYVWQRNGPGGRRRPVWVKVTPGTSERRRHRRKYAQGELIEEEHFFFTGPDGKLNLRAQNLVTFMQIAEGVDDDTWNYHLRRGDIARWFRHVIKDDELADVAEAVAADRTLSAADSRARIREEVEQRYTLPV